MKKELLNKRNKLLRYLTREEYFSYVGFVAKIYVAEYDLKIMMARKFSNLFVSLLDLAKEENGALALRQYSEKFKVKKPEIISNTALRFMKQRIQKGEMKKILLADDIIIHGRTLKKIYEILKSWYQEAGIEDYQIDIFAYAENDGGIIEDEALNRRVVGRKCNTSEWRKISTQIINIFNIVGEPYTSYVPNCKIQKDSENGKKLAGFIKKNQNDNHLRCLTDKEMIFNGMSSYLYVYDEVADFALEYSVRIYDYGLGEEYAVVPMVTLKPMDSSMLKVILEELSDFMQDDFQKTIIGFAESEDEEAYRVVVYLLGALLGWKFASEKIGILPADFIYNDREEKYNFSEKFLRKSERSSFDDYFKKICARMDTKFDDGHIFEGLGRAMNQNDEIKELNTEFGKIINNDFELNKNISWIGNDSGIQKNKIKMEKYLLVNGQLDEKKYKSGDITRYLGIPLYWVLDQFRRKLSEAKSGFEAVMYAIDSGRGSIVSKKIDRYFMAFVHAGEQNYKYYEKYYLPILFGRYIVESDGTKDKKTKDEFWEKYIQYWKSKGLFYCEDDLEVIKNMDICDEFEQLFVDDIRAFDQNVHLKYAMELACK